MLCSISQRYNLKAIHNQADEIIAADEVVFNKSKIQSESNSQRAGNEQKYRLCCVQ